MTPPASIKGVLFVDGQVVLVRNSRDEWELPGGRLENGESHAQTLTREFAEEFARQGLCVAFSILQPTAGELPFVTRVPDKHHLSIDKQHSFDRGGRRHPERRSDGMLVAGSWDAIGLLN